MIAWLLDTFLYTGLLIVAVLLLRRPVGRHFGAQTAYALWALPLLRMLIPTIELPASLAPVPAGTLDGTLVVPVESYLVGAPAAPVVESASLPWAALALAAWLAGAVLFLAWRAWTYFRMREELLACSRPVGEAGSIRLVETPAIEAPVAFGVFDKVVALPMEFMALENRAARDLAIEHELAHHRGRDLLANMLAQPLLALHWFNPFAWAGWRAMRRDQEAACDARVIASRTPAERAHYGEVIASFAAGPRLALAAPMACPILGEKSIIHRLRSLNMSDISPRRRFAGRLLLAGSLLALPLTASVCYAVAPPPAAAAEPPAPPAPPMPPEAPAAPKAPEAPDAPPAPGVVKHVWRTYGGKDGDKEVIVSIRKLAPGEAPEEAGGKPVVRKFALHRNEPMTEEQRKQLEQAGKQWAEQGQKWAQFGQEFGKQFGEDWAKEWQKHAQEWQKAAQEWQKDWRENWTEEGPHAFSLDFEPGQADCRDGTAAEKQAAAKLPHADGGNPMRQVVICERIARNSARSALKEARARVARAQDLSDKDREEVIRSLDHEIERLDRERDDDIDG